MTNRVQLKEKGQEILNVFITLATINLP